MYSVCQTTTETSIIIGQIYNKSKFPAAVQMYLERVYSTIVNAADVELETVKADWEKYPVGLYLTKSGESLVLLQKSLAEGYLYNGYENVELYTYKMIQNSTDSEFVFDSALSDKSVQCVTNFHNSPHSFLVLGASLTGKSDFVTEIVKQKTKPVLVVMSEHKFGTQYKKILPGDVTVVNHFDDELVKKFLATAGSAIIFDTDDYVDQILTLTNPLSIPIYWLREQIVDLTNCALDFKYVAITGASDFSSEAIYKAYAPIGVEATAFENTHNAILAKQKYGVREAQFLIIDRHPSTLFEYALEHNSVDKVFTTPLSAF